MNINKENASSKSVLAPSDLDPSFGIDGFVRIPDPEYPEWILALDSVIAIDPTQDAGQRIYIVSTTPGGSRAYIMRLLAGGQIDKTFGDGGYTALPRVSGQLFDLVVRSFVFDESGYITCFGELEISINGRHYTVPGACRITSSGAVDETFGDKGLAVYPRLGPKTEKPSNYLGRGASLRLGHVGFPGQAEASLGRSSSPAQVTTLVDGKMLFLAPAASCLVRINRDGSLDTDFGENGVVLVTDPVNGEVVNARNYAVHRGGSITVAGHVGTRVSGPGLVARYDVDGRLERGFGESGIVRIAEPDFPAAALQSNSVMVMHDGGVIAVFTSFVGGGDSVTVVIKLRSNGANDPGFNDGKYVILDYGPEMDPVWDTVIDDGNRIVLAGMHADMEGGAGPIYGRISRLMPNGVLDNGFGENGTVVYKGFSPIIAAGIQDRVNIIAVTQDVSTGADAVVVRILG